MTTPAQLFKEKFPNDTDDKLSNYLAKLYPDVKTPEEAAKIVSDADARLKALYLIALSRLTLKNTNLRSNLIGPAFQKLTVADFEGKTNAIQETAKNNSVTEWPNPANFYEKSSVVKDAVVNAIKESLTDKNVPKSVAQFNGRLGNRYGLDSNNIDQSIYRFSLLQQPLKLNESKDNVTAINELLFLTKDITGFPESVKKILVDEFRNVGGPFDKDGNPTIIDINPRYKPKKTANVQQPPSADEQKEIDKKLADEAVAKKTGATSESEKETLMSDQPAPTAEQPAEQPAPADQPAAADVAAQAAAVLAATDVSEAAESELKCDNVKQAATDAEAKVNALLASIDSYASQSSRASKIISDQGLLIEQLLVLKGEKTALESSGAAVQADLLQCKADKADLERRIAENEAKIAELNAKIAELEKTIADLRATAQEIMDQINSYEAKVDDIFTLTEKIALQLANFDGDKAQKLTDLQASLDRRRAEIEKRIQDLQTDLASTGAQGDAAAKECEEKRKQLEDQVEKDKLLQGQLDSINTREATLQRDLLACKKQADAMSTSFYAFCSDQQKYFDKLNGLLDQVSTKVKGTVDSLSALITEQETKVADYQTKVTVAAAPQPSQ